MRRRPIIALSRMEMGRVRGTASQDKYRSSVRR
jgi:hypothetical protein